jgi:hypothetical protein
MHGEEARCSALSWNVWVSMDPWWWVESSSIWNKACKLVMCTGENYRRCGSSTDERQKLIVLIDVIDVLVMRNLCAICACSGDSRSRCGSVELRLGRGVTLFIGYVLDGMMAISSFLCG